MKALQEEASDLDLSLLRYFAATGLAFHTLLGLSPLNASARNRLFDRLLDEERWHCEKRHATPRQRTAR